jgi:hypothetical protein
MRSSLSLKRKQRERILNLGLTRFGLHSFRLTVGVGRGALQGLLH